MPFDRTSRLQPSPDLYNKDFVTKLFDEMSHTYGSVNSVSSLGFCIFWRKQCANLIEVSPKIRIVDLMGGMAELATTLAKRHRDLELEIEAVDLSGAMCELGKQSIAHNQLQDSCTVLQADALDSGISSASVDAVMSTFGLKTFSTQQLTTLASEVFRILKPGGQIAFLEISVPPHSLLRIPYMFYLSCLIPVIGRLFMGNPENYRLLGIYTHQFQSCDSAIDIFRNAGLEIEPKSFFFGCATGFKGRKPTNPT